MRLFIAAVPCGELKNEIIKARDAIRAQGVRGNYTRTEHIHLTLAFIGEFPDPGKVLEVMRGIPFEGACVSLSGLGRFGDLWWCALSCPGTLYGYAERLRKELSRAGIPFDGRPFKPHVTILRRADREFVPPDVKQISGTIEKISLMRSDRDGGVLRYTALGSVRPQVGSALQRKDGPGHAGDEV